MKSDNERAGGPVLGCSVPAADFYPSPTSNREPSTDEALLMYVLRLLNEGSVEKPLPAVKRALVLGARRAFKELVQTCDAMLNAKPSPSAASAAPPLSTVAPSRSADSDVDVETPSSQEDRPGTRPARDRRKRE